MAMKKMKIDSARMKEFFLQHGEKIAFGVLALLALFLCYKGLTRGTYAGTPAEMQEAANRFQTSWQSRQPPTVTLTDTSAALAAATSRIDGPITVNRPPNPPLFAPVDRRGEPALLPPVQVIGTASAGAIAYLDQAALAAASAPQPAPRFRTARQQNQQQAPAADGSGPLGFVNVPGARPQGKQWVVLTAAVPIKEQWREYQSKFERSNLKQPETDYPHYVSMKIQRSESTGDGFGPWQDIDVYQAESEMKNWIRTAPELVEDSYRELDVCMPLPPLMGKQHDIDTVGHPLVLARGEGVKEELTLEEEGEAEGEEATEGTGVRRLFGAAARNRRQTPAAQPQGGQPQRPQSTSGRTTTLGGGVARAAPEHDYTLCRYFDFTVEPNKTYRYRIALVLTNPNYGVAPQFLERPDLAIPEYIETPFSEPSMEISVPGTTDLFAGKVKPPFRLADAVATMLIRKWDDQQATTLINEIEVARGALANFPAIEAKFQDPATGEVKTETVELTTNILVLDLAGGEKIENLPDGVRLRSVTAPSEVLVVDSDGVIKQKHGLVDARAIARARRDIEQRAQAVAEPQPAEGGERGGGLQDGARVPRGR